MQIKVTYLSKNKNKYVSIYTDYRDMCYGDDVKEEDLLEGANIK